MIEKEFNNLIKKDKYQVFIFTSPSSLPFSFARHPWFVINKKGAISRWEVLLRENPSHKGKSYLHMNFLPPHMGMEIVPFVPLLHWKATLLETIEGDEDSIAAKMINVIENSKETYPYCDKYYLTGPNSDTYGQWILNNFSELNIKLPWNSIGKNFKIK